MTYAVMCAIQGFTYNGMTTLNPIMVTGSYRGRDLGTVLGVLGISYAIVGVTSTAKHIEDRLNPNLKTGTKNGGGTVLAHTPKSRASFSEDLHWYVSGNYNMR